jgi:hypothetical protein
MTTRFRHFTFGLLVLACAAFISSCSTEDTGQTLIVDAWPGVEVFERALPSTTTAYSLNTTAKVVYRGSKKLVYVWSWLNKPLDGGIVVTPTETSVKIDFSGFVATTGPNTGVSTIYGDYVMQLLVYESNGSLSEKDSFIVRLTRSSNG